MRWRDPPELHRSFVGFVGFGFGFWFVESGLLCGALVSLKFDF